MTMWESETPCEALAEVMSYTGLSADLVTGIRIKLAGVRLVLIPTDLTDKDGSVLIPINSPEARRFRNAYGLVESSCAGSKIHLFNRRTWALEGRALDADAASHFGSTHIIALRSLRNIDRVPLAVPPSGYAFGIHIVGYSGIGDF